ncbi:MAG: trans-aconitate 2-methyltransferase [Ramlibacter sp.]
MASRGKAAGPRLPPPLAEVGHYYDLKARRHGPTPRGVDWPDAPSQALRFAQLLKLCDFAQPRSLNDLGCGYGALLDHLRQHHPGAAVDYRGVDVAPSMIELARQRHAATPTSAFVVASSPGRVADYSVASGIFNVKLECAEPAWEALVAATLADLSAHSRIGFAANFIEPAQPGVGSPHQLYRVARARWTAHCIGKLGCRVEIVDGYGLPEYTLIARKHS